MPQELMRSADVLARRLYAAGCRHAFGMPGGEVLTLVDALERAGIRFVLAKHENAAGFMAEGVWHRTGAPGIMVGTVGPGILNGVNVVANALQDQVPLIVLSGCVDAAEAERYTHQVVDQAGALKPLVKASFVLEAHAADLQADKAVGIATEGRMGPVHIDVPISVADQEVAAKPAVLRQPAAPVVPAPEVLEPLRKAIGAAQRPILVVGVDALNQRYDATKPDLAAELREVVDKLSIPVVTTYKAKGLLPEDHPLSLGGGGLSPLADRILLPLIAKADVVIGLGYDPVEMRPGWQNVFSPETQTVIDITAVSNTHYMHQATHNLVADCGATLRALTEGLPAKTTWAAGDIKATKAELAQAFPKDDTWGPAAVMDEARQALPRNALATVDSGAHRILLSQMWECYEPRALTQSTALCTMGCAVPLAIGAALASPDRQVISFSGDAGLLMVAGEIATARELGVSPIFLVFVDASLALIEKKQRERQMSNAGVDFAIHDFAALGRAFGGQGFDVKNRQELREALEAGMASETFTVIAAHIDREAYDGRI